MKKKYFLIIVLTIVSVSVFCQNKIPLYASGNAAGYSMGTDNSNLSVTGQNVIGVTANTNNTVYIGLLAPVRYVLTDVKTTEIGSTHLYQNFPNPFKQNTTISFEIAKTEKVKLTVVDILGQHVDLLLDQYLFPGKHHVFFNAENTKPGMYFYRLETTDFRATKNMILTK